MGSNCIAWGGMSPNCTFASLLSICQFKVKGYVLSPTPVSCTCIANQPLPCLPMHTCTCHLFFHANMVPILKYLLLVIHVSLVKVCLCVCVEQTAGE